jgi:predicted glycosyltransferase
MAKNNSEATLSTHGAKTLPSVEVDSYNLELEDEDGLIHDSARKGAFRRMLDEVWDTLRKEEEDPLGDEDSEAINKKLDKVLAKGDPDAAAVVQTAIETFAEQLAHVVKRLLCQKSWREGDSLPGPRWAGVL